MQGDNNTLEVQGQYSHLPGTSCQPRLFPDFRHIRLREEPKGKGDDGIIEGSTTSRACLKVVTTLEDTSIFLGGLIKHPTESTKHFTILRHSHGLVVYRGPSTSLAISVFSEEPLPPNRRFWLQVKGWTGNTGMAAKVLFRSNSDWVNVTPAHQVEVTTLPHLDERAWQRDVKKFVSKSSKAQQAHMWRETAMVRIRYEANDGYFRLVLTSGTSRSVLCPSPVFRMASTSMSASSVKGASLTTLPIELGVKAAQTAATTMATRVIVPWVGVVKDRVTNTASTVKIGNQVKSAWDVSGIRGRLGVAELQYEARPAEISTRGSPSRTSSAPTIATSSIVGSPKGPQSPFPVHLVGTVNKGSGRSMFALSMPTANLDDLALDLLAPLPLDVYCGWGKLALPSGKPRNSLQDDWQYAVITVAYSSLPRIARRKCVRAYLVYDYPPGDSFFGSELKLMLMGYLRPLIDPDETDVLQLEPVNDILITRASLSRPAWSHSAMLRTIRAAKSERSMTDRMVDVRLMGQRQINSVPVHMLGVRNESVGLHDRAIYGHGGFWVKRD